MEEQGVGAPLAGARAGDVITVVVTANNHLGCGTFGEHSRGGGRVNRAQERVRRLRRAFQQATDFAVGQGVDLFLQVGDLFDTRLAGSPREEDRSFVAARLAELRQAGVRVFAVSGVHDTPGDSVADAGGENDVAGGSGALGSGPAPLVSYARLGALHYFPPLPMSRSAGAVEKGRVPRGKAPGAEPGQGDDDAGASTASRSVDLQGVGVAQPGGKVEVEPVMVDVRGVALAVCGLSVVAGQEGDPLARVDVGSEVEGAACSLLLLHAPIEGVVSSSSAMDGRVLPVVARSTIAGQSCFDVILAGYEHGYRHVRIGSTDVVVVGATQQMDGGDAGDEPGFVFLGLGSDGIRWCQHIPVEGVCVRRLVIDAAELERSFAVAQDDKALAGAQDEKGFADAQSLPLSEQRRDDGSVAVAQSLPLSDVSRREPKPSSDVSRSPERSEGEGEGPEERRGRDEGGTARGVSPTEMILERLRPLCGADSMVELRLVGELGRDRYHQLDLGAIRAFGEECCFELAIDESGLSLLPGDASFGSESNVLSRNGYHAGPSALEERGGGETSEMLSEAKHDKEGHDKAKYDKEGRGKGGEERLSAREELVRLADEWIAEASDEQEKRALMATKEELLAALDGRKTRRE